MIFIRSFSLLAFLASSLQAAHETKPLSEDQLKAHKLDGKFFKKGTEVEGILIATSDRVSDYAHAESAYLFGKIMQSIDKKVAQRIRDKRVLCILIGHAGHPEVEGTMGQYDHSNGGEIYLVEDEEDVANLEVKDPGKLSYVTQTTLSMDDTARVIDALRAKFPEIQGPRKDDICYATQNRQDAVKQLAGDCDLMLVVGSPNSSNSNRLRELAERMGTPAYLIDEASQIDAAWLEGKTSVGVTAGASAPEVLVNDVITRLRELGGSVPEEIAGREENIVFSMPRELRIDASNVD